MEPSRSKKQRLMQPYILLQRPDLPARFESLNDDTLTTVLEFVGDKSYKSFGGLNRHCRKIYLSTEGMTKETFLFGYAPLSVIKDRLERASNCFHDLKSYERIGKGIMLYNRRDLLTCALHDQIFSLLLQICHVAVGEERFDILDEVWNNVDQEHKERFIFRDLHEYAARHGKLNTLKWQETKGLPINKEACASQAARYSQLHILQWLREERGFEFKRLSGLLYNDAIEYGGHMRILKWLREKGCPWYEYTFRVAAQEGNLDILQWLHDEGCPWPNYYDDRLDEDKVKPEVVDWCRANGYGDRFDND